MGTGDRPEPAKAADRTGTGSGRAGRWVRGRTGRWVAAGAAVIVLGGGAAAVALHHEGEDRGDRKIAGERERHDGRDRRDGDERGAQHQGDRAEPGRRTNEVPAPLPSTDAADAVTKASSAVPGGKVESLSPATEQSGGRAWQAVVLGPDGVRHLVTLDGTSGAVTGNTVLRG
ncbi:hypothetical protein J2S46_007299 [Kitasatospora herbaricolor]|uniref:hypothetical protein n=1 Tax=Kitasatospora herbaricolor TaxID=68217 RepID=UPI00188B76DF|nr:hypothetical protein [Kitasatospora herbaricolor]MDQ0312743.1 hypothetical protein [Kitasatospora herbaricolor]